MKVNETECGEEDDTKTESVAEKRDEIVSTTEVCRKRSVEDQHQ